MTSAIPVQRSYQLSYQANWDQLPVGLIAQLVIGIPKSRPSVGTDISWNRPLSLKANILFTTTN